MTDKVQDLRKCYGRLKAFIQTLPSGNIQAFYIDDHRSIISKIQKLIDDDISEFLEIDSWSGGSRDRYCNSDQIRSRASQVVGILEYGYNISDNTIEIGSLYNAIKDKELRERCGDLLTASSHFDRVINQATLVLEDRIRNRTGSDKSLYGVGLVAATIKNDPSISKIVFSNTNSEQDGYASIIRGIMLALRNETHHTIVDTFSREDALSICGFIDRILRLIDNAKIT